MKTRTRHRAALVASVALATPLAAQVQTEVPPVVPGAKPATVERVKIHGTALEGNLEGNAVDRDAIVFLPPSYAKEKSRRYPVVYALHGYSIGAEQWAPEIHVPQTLEGAFAQGAQEVIVVLPDSKTVHNGSMYSSSVTTGDFERYVVGGRRGLDRRPLPHDSTEIEPRPGRPLHGRLRRDPHRHEASRRVRERVHHEPVLPLSAGGRLPRRRHREVPGGGEDARRFGGPPVLCPRPARQRGGLVARPEESAALSPAAHAGRRAASGRAREMGGQRPARLPGSIRREPAPVSRASPSTSATRTACGPTRRSCTTRSTATASRTPSRSTPARTRARWPIASRTT